MWRGRITFGTSALLRLQKHVWDECPAEAPETGLPVKARDFSTSPKCPDGPRGPPNFL
jgi:hypothetical protein